jgi:hypothetical protein
MSYFTPYRSSFSAPAKITHLYTLTPSLHASESRPPPCKSATQITQALATASPTRLPDRGNSSATPQCGETSTTRAQSYTPRRLSRLIPKKHISSSKTGDAW